MRWGMDLRTGRYPSCCFLWSLQSEQACLQSQTGRRGTGSSSGQYGSQRSWWFQWSILWLKNPRRKGTSARLKWKHLPREVCKVRERIIWANLKLATHSQSIRLRGRALALFMSESRTSVIGGGHNSVTVSIILLVRGRHESEGHTVRLQRWQLLY